MAESMAIDGEQATTPGSFFLQVKMLFGGALSVSLPAEFVDVSLVRQLSDTQECWADAATDQSFVMEILAHDDDVADAQSAQFYMDDIAQCNDAEGTHTGNLSEPQCITSIFTSLLEGAPTNTTLPPPSCWEVRAIQHVAKFKEQERNAVVVHLAVIRVPSVDSDIVIHLNQPLAISQSSSSATVAHATPAGTAEQGAELFRSILASLQVRDWGLFASPNEGDEEFDDIAGEGAAAG